MGSLIQGLFVLAGNKIECADGYV